MFNNIPLRCKLFSANISLRTWLMWLLPLRTLSLGKPGGVVRTPASLTLHWHVSHPASPTIATAAHFENSQQGEDQEPCSCYSSPTTAHENHAPATPALLMIMITVLLILLLLLLALLLLFMETNLLILLLLLIILLMLLLFILQIQSLLLLAMLLLLILLFCNKRVITLMS